MSAQTREQSVTFLMPAFGMLWGYLLLDETITFAMVAGAALIVEDRDGIATPARAIRIS